MSDSEGSNVRPGAESQSAQYQQAGYARDQCQWDSEQHRGWGPAARWQRVEATAFRSWGQVGARDAWGDTLALFCLGLQKYKALLVLAEQLGYGHIFDSRRRRTRTIFLGYHRVQRYRHRGGSTSSIVRTGATPMNVVDMLDARFRQSPHIWRYRYALLAIREGSDPAHSGGAARGKLELCAL